MLNNKILKSRNDQLKILKIEGVYAKTVIHNTLK